MRSTSHLTPSAFRHAFIGCLPPAQQDNLHAAGASLWEALLLAHYANDPPDLPREIALALADLLIAAQQLGAFGGLLDFEPEHAPLIRLASDCGEVVLSAAAPLQKALEPSSGEALREEIDRAAGELGKLVMRLRTAIQAVEAEEADPESADRLQALILQHLGPAEKQLAGLSGQGE